jgi:hypothetical protein
VRLTEKGKALRGEARERRPAWAARAFGDDPAGAKALKEGVVALRERLLAGWE